MIKKILKTLGALLLLAVVVLAAGLSWAHWAIRQEHAALPSFDTLLAANTEGGPVKLSYINTATQEMPRSSVLDPKQDPKPHDPYVMSHPSYVLEWPDGRILLVDTGMTRQGATDFGRPIELMGGKPIQPLVSAAEKLGPARSRVAGAVFTHLHTDHVGGITGLCANDKPIPVFMTPAQAQRPNYTTRPGLDMLRKSGCAQLQELPETSLAPVPDFPGVYVIPAGGHTPGSQIIIANLQTANGVRRVAFIGDIVNNIDGVNHNLPKPFFYSLLIVPEDRSRLDELRRWLRTLRDSHGVQLLAAHDQLDIERNQIPPWSGS